jgi:hypothetical protein
MRGFKVLCDDATADHLGYGRAPEHQVIAPRRGRITDAMLLDAAIALEQEGADLRASERARALHHQQRQAAPQARAGRLSHDEWIAGIHRRCAELDEVERQRPPAGYRATQTLAPAPGAASPAARRSAGTVLLQGIGVHFNMWSPTPLAPSAGDQGNPHRERFLPGCFHYFGTTSLELGHRGREVARIADDNLVLWSNGTALYFEARVDKAALNEFVGPAPVTMLAVSISCIDEAAERIWHVSRGWQKTVERAQLTNIALLRPGVPPAHAGTGAWLV